jgi:nickel transport protein
VFSPVDYETEFQEGFTDKNGCFAFFPDTSGTWQIKVDDGMGHLLKVNLDIGETLVPDRENGRSHLSRFYRALIGVSLIFGIFGVATLLLRHRHSNGHGV